MHYEIEQTGTGDEHGPDAVPMPLTFEVRDA
jgi:hypothetical protein